VLVAIAGLFLAASALAIFVALRGLAGNPLPDYRSLLPESATDLEWLTGAPTVVEVPFEVDQPTPEAPVQAQDAPQTQPETTPTTAAPRADSTPGASPLVGAPQQSNVDYAAQIFDESNLARRLRGLPELAFSQCAADQATARAAALVGTGTLEHAPLAPVIEACWPPGLQTAENLLRGDVSAAEGVEMWLNSPGHAANLLDPDLTMLGVGCVRDETGPWPGWICAQIFLR